MNEKYIPDNLPIDAEFKETVATLRAQIEAINKREDGRVFKVSTKADDFAVKVLEQRIRSIESKGKTAILRERIDEINKQSSRTHGERRDSDEAEVIRLEAEIRKLEGSNENGQEESSNEDKIPLGRVDVKNDYGSSDDVEEPVEPVEPVEGAFVDKEFLVNALSNNNDNDEETENKSKRIENVAEAEVMAYESAKRKEYFNLKKEAREARTLYEESLAKEFAERSKGKKLFGLGRENSTDEVKVLREAKIAAENKQIKFGNESGVYQQIIDRENSFARRKDGEEISLAAALSLRHMIIPAEKKMELQTVHMQENLSKLKSGLLEKIQANNKVAKTVGFIAALMTPAIAKAAPLAAQGYTAYKYTFNTAAAVTGFAVAYLGGKFITGRLNDKRDSLAASGTESFGDLKELDLDKLEAEYFKSVNRAHNSKNYTRMAAAGAALAAGVFVSPEDFSVGAGADKLNDALASSEGLQEAIDSAKDVIKNASDQIGDVLKNPDGISDIIKNPYPDGFVPVPDKPFVGVDVDVPFRPGGLDVALPEPDVDSVTNTDAPAQSPDNGLNIDLKYNPDAGLDSLDKSSVSAFEAIEKVESGDTTSDILFDALKERLSAGEFELPEGATKDTLAHKMYQTFPEMTSASGVDARLSPADWVKLGVESGDPHKIFPGDEINVEALVKIMEGNSVKDVMDNLGNLDSLGASDIDLNLDSLKDSIATPYDVSQNITPSTENIVPDLNLDSLKDPIATPYDVSPNITPSPENIVPDLNLDSLDDPAQTPYDQSPNISSVTGSVPAGMGIDTLNTVNQSPGVPVEAVDSVSVNNGAESIEPEVSVEGASIQPDVFKEPIPSDFYKVEGLYVDMKTLPGELVKLGGVEKYLGDNLIKGLISQDIILPVEFTADPYDFAGDPRGLIEARLPELSTKLLEINKPTLSEEVWKALGISSGDPLVVGENDTLKTTELLKYILGGDKDALEIRLGLQK